MKDQIAKLNEGIQTESMSREVITLFINNSFFLDLG
jgi:hypothetical protein